MIKKILLVFGTRPEAIKMAPLVDVLSRNDRFEVRIAVTAQHRQMLDQVLNLFKINPNYDFNIMKPGQNLSDVTSEVLLKIGKVLDDFLPDIVLVHGDTATTFASALAAYYKKIPVGHVEAGLRTGNIYAPWPEEGNRKLTAALAQLHFAPTNEAKNNLLNENFSENSVFVTGNTVIDALLRASDEIDSNIEIKEKFDKKFNFLENSKKIILVTGHRRENFGSGIASICNSLIELSKRNDVQIIYPVHMNPNIKGPVEDKLLKIKNIFLLEPLDYLSFVFLMKKSYLILTDSGGIQEEAPALKKPVLVMRDTTERPEAIVAGTARLVGTDPDKIIEEVNFLLDDTERYLSMIANKNPYGDGFASQKILNVLCDYFNFKLI